MNNIHLIPTDKSSKLYLGNNGNFVFGMMQTSIQSRNDDFTNQDIYITSDEEIKEEDWLFSTKTNNLFKADSIEYLESHNMIEDFDKSFYINSKYAKKIILTTNQDLIKGGIQPIDDEFLEWFVKNPNCEEIEVIPLRKSSGHYDEKEIWHWDFLAYKIIIPKEPKQETSIIEDLKDIYKHLEKMCMRHTEEETHREV